MLRIVTNAPWYITNEILHCDLIPLMKEAIKSMTEAYRGRILDHPNKLTHQLMANIPYTQRLKKKIPSDHLTTMSLIMGMLLDIFRA